MALCALFAVALAASGDWTAAVLFALAAIFALPVVATEAAKQGTGRVLRVALPLTFAVAAFIFVPTTPAGPSPKASPRSTPEEGSEITEPARLADQVQGVLDVQSSYKLFFVRVELGEQWSESTSVAVAGIKLEQIARAIQAGARETIPENETLRVRFYVPTVDRLGNESTGQLFQIDMSISDVKKANFDNLGYVGTLNLASDVSSKAIGASAAEAWCSDPSNLEQARVFCSLALNL